VAKILRVCLFFVKEETINVSVIIELSKDIISRYSFVDIIIAKILQHFLSVHFIKKPRHSAGALI
jgi:hypothetical protein